MFPSLTHWVLLGVPFSPILFTLHHFHPLWQSCSDLLHSKAIWVFPWLCPLVCCVIPAVTCWFLGLLSTTGSALSAPAEDTLAFCSAPALRVQFRVFPCVPTMGNLWSECAKEMLVAQVVEQDVWLGTPASTSVSLGWERDIFITCSAYMALQSSGLGCCFFFFPSSSFLARFQFNSWCVTSLTQLWLSKKSCCPFVFWPSSCAAEPAERPQELLFGSQQHKAHSVCASPCDVLKSFEELGEKLLLNLLNLLEEWRCCVPV